MNIVQALTSLAPNAQWQMDGSGNITWLSSDIKQPTADEIEKYIRTQQHTAAVELFKQKRTEIMNQYDWMFIRELRTGKKVPANIKKYLDELTKIENSKSFSPQITYKNRKWELVMESVKWPVLK